MSDRPTRSVIRQKIARIRVAELYVKINGLDTVGIADFQNPLRLVTEPKESAKYLVTSQARLTSSIIPIVWSSTVYFYRLYKLCINGNN